MVTNHLSERIDLVADPLTLLQVDDMWGEFDNMDIETDLKEEISLLDRVIENEANRCVITEWVDSESNYPFPDLGFCGSPIREIDTHTRLLDEAEMHWDMCKWEEEEAQHNLFLKNPWNHRGDLQQCEMNRRSEVNALVKVTKVGRDYLTGTTCLGKVYIPKHLWGDLGQEDMGGLGYMRIRFLGSEDCRPTGNMPWRAMEVYYLDRRGSSMV
jgi:hypothetical protein